jgi:hypothetical protein
VHYEPTRSTTSSASAIAHIASSLGVSFGRKKKAELADLAAAADATLRATPTPETAEELSRSATNGGTTDRASSARDLLRRF